MEVFHFSSRPRSWSPLASVKICNRSLKFNVKFFKGPPMWYKNCKFLGRIEYLN